MFAADLTGALAESVDQQVAILHSDGPIAAPFRVPTVVLGMKGPRVPGLRMRMGTVLALRGLLREWQPDIIQVHGGEPLKYAVSASSRSAIDLVYRRIGSATYGSERGARRAVHARLMRRVTAVVAVAEAVRRETIEVFRLPKERVLAIPNAVDARRLRAISDRVQMRRSLGVGRDVPMLLSIGALTWEKDPLEHVSVAEQVRGVRPDLLHLLVGDGPLRGSVERRIRERGLADCVRMLGARRDIPDLLAASDVLLLASRTEGMPGVVIEAGMMGTSVAAYGLAGVPEVIEDGVTGFLVPPTNRDALVARVLDLLAMPQRRMSMGEAAKRRCLERFDIQSVAPRYLELYERLIGHPSRHRSSDTR